LSAPNAHGIVDGRQVGIRITKDEGGSSVTMARERESVNRGCLFTVEGGEGAGKSTVIARWSEYLQSLGLPVITSREPGGIEIAERIRDILLDRSHTRMDGRTEALLYAAARRQHLVEKVIPALERGTTVVCDRFIDSSLAYQGYARGLGIDDVLAINRFAIGETEPDLTLVLDVDPEVGLSRIQTHRSGEVNRLDLESLAFHRKVREGYGILASRFPERIVMIDASRDPDAVFTDVKRITDEFLAKKDRGC